MRMLITGTSGRLGAALAQHFAREPVIIGLDVAPGLYTTRRGHNTEGVATFVEPRLERWGVLPTGASLECDRYA